MEVIANPWYLIRGRSVPLTGLVASGRFFICNQAANWYSLGLGAQSSLVNAKDEQREVLMSTIVTLPSSFSGLGSLPSPAIMGSLYRMTVDQYERLVESGVLDGQPIELIDGLLVRKMAKKPPHVIASEAMRDELLGLVPRGWRLTIEAPVRIPEFDEPEPDLGVVRGTRDQYKDHHPGPADIGLLIEVSDTTLDRDRGEKQLAYARGGVPIYWIVNLVDHQVEIYIGPTPTGYRDRRVLTPNEQIPVVLDGQEIGQITVRAVLASE
jgi:Uma2 family endonuclease